MKINREELHRLYLNKVTEVAEECDWVTSFSIEDVVSLISLVIEQNPRIIQIDTNLHDGSTLDKFLLEEENANLKKELKRLERTNSQLRDELSNPPADVQEYVLHKLGVREIIMELEKEIRDLKEQIENK
jgi:predicted RNase H-like nuclease (RuvC/YqgF family)